MLRLLLLPFLFCQMGFVEAISSALGAGAGLLGGIYQANSAKKSAADQMHFQQRLSNRAHQREIKDLKAAGLNPILSAKYGGASTPTGAGYQIPNIGASAAQGAQSASSAAQIRAQTVLTSNDAVKSGQEAKLFRDEPWIVLAKQFPHLSTAELIALRTYYNNYMANGAKNNGAPSPAKSYGTKMNQYDNSKNQAGRWEDIRYGGSRTGKKKTVSKSENADINRQIRNGDATRWPVWSGEY